MVLDVLFSPHCYLAHTDLGVRECTEEKADLYDVLF